MEQKKKYSISDIDRMRNALRYLKIENMVPYYEEELAAAVEDQLRTHMMNGTDPHELEQAIQKKRQLEHEWEREREERMRRISEPETLRKLFAGA